MCGILGAIGRFSNEEITKYSNRISHRGPDNESAEIIDNTYLFHTRLSIVDLNSSSDQPLWDSNKKACIIFNGEIYNYKELRNELIELGYHFLSQGDAEVIANLYLHFGIDCLNKLNGIFAFAIWDVAKNILFIARDAFGVKPLYYTQNEQGFYFSSESKALVELPGVSKELNYDALLRTIIFLWSPGPETIFKTIHKLKPGHYLIIKDQHTVEQKEYWAWPKYEPIKRTEQETIAKLDDLMLSSVKEQLVSDVPIGAFLSGGLDSSLIVAMAKKSGIDQLECFTINSADNSDNHEGFVDDLPYAKKVAAELGTKLNIVEAKPDILNLLPKMIYHLDEPQADPAAINVLLISELARQLGIKVLFSGAGGDDVFTGYRRHRAIELEKYWVWAPKICRRVLQKGARNIPKGNPYLRRIAKIFSYASLPEDERILSYFYWMDPKLALSLLTEDVQNKVSKAPMALLLNDLAKRNESHKLEKMLYLERRYFLVDHNFNYTDKMSMAHGVEVRVPFLSKSLADFSSSLHVKFKQKKSEGKWILKKMAEKYLPKSVIYRSKSGFGAPLRVWIKKDLKPLIDTLLSKDSLLKRGLFKPEAVHELISKNNSGKEDYTYPIFSLLCIELWCRIFLDNEKF